MKIIVKKRSVYLCLILSIALCLTGCRLTAPTVPQEAPEDDLSLAQPNTPPAATRKPADEVMWVIQINDTQQIMDETGLKWNYTLTLYASKRGGQNATGGYTGEANLTIEPDFDLVKRITASEGVESLPALYRYDAECDGLSFELAPYSEDEYAAQMQEVSTDCPFSPSAVSVDRENFALASTAFCAVQAPFIMTIEDNGSAGCVRSAGSAAQADILMEITTNGSEADCSLYGTSHQLACAFSGTAIGERDALS